MRSDYSINRIFRIEWIIEAEDASQRGLYRYNNSYVIITNMLRKDPYSYNNDMLLCSEANTNEPSRRILVVAH